MSLITLLDDKIEAVFKENPELSEAKKDKFETAVAQIVNVKLLGGLDLEELTEGIIGGGGDEGIDMCYLFHNEELVNNEDDLTDRPILRSSTLELKIFQTKSSTGFSTSGFGKLCEGIEEIIIFDEKNLKEISGNKDLLEKARLINKALRFSKSIGAKFLLNVYYVTKGDTKKLDEKINYYKQTLKEKLKLYVEEIDFDFLGAEELLNISNIPDENIEFNVEPGMIDLRNPTKKIEGFACFIKGDSILNSLKDKKSGKIRDEFFDVNVRDYLGEKKAINQSIVEVALSKDTYENFWAMNNGITIVGDAVRSISSTSIVVENPQIVNGCQTIYSLYSASQKNGLQDGLKVFAKIIQVKDSQIQQDIISASNSQNTVEYTGFKANDPIQRNIEKFLIPKGYYYERRVNYYKRRGKRGLNVVSIKKMGQIMQTVFMKQSIRALNDVRGLFDDEKSYNKIFNNNADYDAYLFAYSLYKNIWIQKSGDLRKNKYKPVIRELISKGLFPLLHISSSIALCSENPIDFCKPERKNLFSAQKKVSFAKVEKAIAQIYMDSKEIYFNCIKAYEKDSRKNPTTLLKQRSFDKDYIMPEVAKFLKK